MKTALIAFLLLTFATSSRSQYLEYGLPEDEQTGQKMIKTSDGGFLIVASKSCYTPGYIYFHGCPTGTYLIRLNQSGDTLWTNQVSANGYHRAHLYENADGTFTIISRDFNNFECGYLGVSGLGLLQLITMHISATGEVLSEASYPQECELSLRSVVQLSDNRFALLTVYQDINYWYDYENRLYIMDKDLNILDSTHIFSGDMNSGELFLNKNNEIILIYADADSLLNMNVFNTQLDLISSYTNQDLKLSCFAVSFTDREILELDNGDLVMLCSDYSFGNHDVELAHFNDELTTLAHKQLSLIDATDMVLVNQDRVAIVSQNIDLPKDDDIQLSYYTPSGDSLETTIIRRQGVQRPTDITLLDNNKIAVTGNVNCCNEADSIGPSKSFLYLGELSTDLEPLVSNDANFITPNPTNDFINIVFNDVVIESTTTLTLSLYSMSGSRISEITLDNTARQISVRHLIPGIYLAVLKSDNEVLLRSKLIKI